MENHVFKSVENTVKHWYMPLIVGLILVGAGIWVFATPLKSYLALTLIFSVSFIITGIIEILFAVTNRKELNNWGLSLIFGSLCLIFGIHLILNPEISMTTLPYYVGFVVLFRSINAVSSSFDLKKSGVSD